MLHSRVPEMRRDRCVSRPDRVDPDPALCFHKVGEQLELEKRFRPIAEFASPTPPSASEHPASPNNQHELRTSTVSRRYSRSCPSGRLPQSVPPVTPHPAHKPCCPPDHAPPH